MKACCYLFPFTCSPPHLFPPLHGIPASAYMRVRTNNARPPPVHPAYAARGRAVKPRTLDRGPAGCMLASSLSHNRKPEGASHMSRTPRLVRNTESFIEHLETRQVMAADLVAIAGSPDAAS